MMHKKREREREREPLIDIINEIEEIKIVAELPGVAKENVKLYANENTLTIESSASAEERRYYKKNRISRICRTVKRKISL
jgi:HSP20 family molecular chaperone IbpA